MDFMSNLQNTINNTSYTENGMEGYKSTMDALVDFNFRLSSFRNLPDREIIKQFCTLLESDRGEYALKYLFMARDVREGQGERHFFRVCLKALVEYASFSNKDEIISDLIHKEIKEYGRFDDLFIFLNTPYEDILISTIKEQLKEDKENMALNKPVSLLAKWMPSINASSYETRNLARVFVEKLGLTQKEYRKLLSGLRKYQNVLETQMSSNLWSEIDYNHVPSNANLLYRSAFLNHDFARRIQYLDLLSAKDKSVKIHSEVNYPHQIVHGYTENVSGNFWNHSLKPEDQALECLWKNLKPIPSLEETIVVRDGSGSMTRTFGEDKIAPIEVATALALYCAERLSGAFKDKFITFSEKPKLVDVSKCKSLRDKLVTTYQEDDWTNTNIRSVFHLILKTACENYIPNDRMPKRILILSDMEFDPYDFNGSENVFATMEKKYKEAGYDIPCLVFWNLASRTNTIPCLENAKGLYLVSGFSTNTLKVLDGDISKMEEALLAQLNSERYLSIPLLKDIQL